MITLIRSQQLLLAISMISSLSVSSQVLHSESFSVIINTTKTIKGGIVPDFKFQNLKEDLLEIENVADISFRFGNNALTFANKIEFSRFGDETLLSGGFIYLEYRRIYDNRIVLEPYSQLHWAEARGLAFKYAGGANLRYRVHLTEEIGVYVASGPFYEFERWGYRGVKENNLPVVISDIEVQEVKLGSYVSVKWLVGPNVNLDFSAYHQSRFDALFSSPRLASSTSVKYFFTEHLGLILQYQNIFDSSPIVPIPKYYNKVVFSINVSF